MGLCDLGEGLCVLKTNKLHFDNLIFLRPSVTILNLILTTDPVEAYLSAVLVQCQ